MTKRVRRGVKRVIHAARKISGKEVEQISARILGLAMKEGMKLKAMIKNELVKELARRGYKKR